MYKIDYGFGPFKNTKYFTTYGEAAEYCRMFKWKVSRIKPVH